MGLRTLHAINKLCHSMLASLSYFAENLFLSIMHFLGLKAKTALFFHYIKRGSFHFLVKIGATDSTQKGSISETDISFLRGIFQSLAFI